MVADDVRAGTIAAEHLLARGRRRIVHMSDDVTYVAAHDRGPASTPR